ncbi:Major Facilitator Superfamily protein [uncultured archaeon]|nr:Major Facilitator Superfamily protein [uncultured archaeon]
MCIGFIFANSWLQLAALFAAYGIFVAADESVNKAYIVDKTEEGKRGMAIGAYNTAIGTAYLPASIIAGALWTMYGPVAPLSLAAGIAVLAAIALYIRVK